MSNSLRFVCTSSMHMQRQQPLQIKSVSIQLLLTRRVRPNDQTKIVAIIDADNAKHLIPVGANICPPSNRYGNGSSPQGSSPNCQIFTPMISHDLVTDILRAIIKGNRTFLFWTNQHRPPQIFGAHSCHFPIDANVRTPHWLGSIRARL